MANQQLLLQLIIEKDADAYAASCPALPGCISWGKTYEEAYQNIHEAVLCYIEGIKKLNKNRYALTFKNKGQYVQKLKQPSMVVAI